MDARTGSIVWERVALEEERANHSCRFATRHEGIAADGWQAAFHRRMAAVHRDSERRHQATADLYCSEELRHALESEEPGRARPPAVMAEAAAVAGARAAVVTTVDPRAFQSLVAASDSRARRAQDMEFVLGEGPCRDVLTERGPVSAEGAEVEARWPAYGPEIRALGYHDVAAVPLYLRATLAGVLVLFDVEARAGSGPRPAAGRLGTVLARVLTAEAPAVLGTETGPRTDLVQAAEVIALHRRSTLEEAIASIRARAIAEHRRVDSVLRTMLEECASQSV